MSWRDIDCIKGFASKCIDSVFIGKVVLHLKRTLLKLIFLECSQALGRLEASVSSR